MGSRMAAAHLCVEYEKSDITATNAGAIDFLAAEPARFAIAIPKCRYCQLDHWRVRVSPGAPTIVGWDGAIPSDRAARPLLFPGSVP